MKASVITEKIKEYKPYVLAWIHSALGGFRFVGSGGITAEPDASGLTINIDGSAVKGKPVYITVGLNLDVSNAPFIDAIASVTNYDGAHTTSITWEVRRDGPDGVLLQTVTAEPNRDITVSTVIKGRTYANPLMLVTYAGDVWIGVKATNSNGRTSEQTAELIPSHNMGSMTFTVDGSVTVNATIATNTATDLLWDFGDGTTITTAATTSHVVVHNYAGTSTYTVTISGAMNTITGFKAENSGLIGDISAFGFTRYAGEPVGWSGIPNIVTLQLRDNALTGLLPSEWAELSVLDLIDLRSNSLVGQLPLSWGGSSSITRIFLDNNTGMGGTIPHEWGNMAQLTSVNLANCGLVGSIPESLSQAVGITRFVVRDNNLSGSIPDAFQLWTLIDFFNVANNNLSGTLPAGFSAWTIATLVYFDNNNISGTVPTSWAAMVGLERLRLNANQLTAAAGSLGACPALVEYRIDINQIGTADVDNLLAAIDGGSALAVTVRMETQNPVAPPTGGAGNANILSIIGKGGTVAHD